MTNGSAGERASSAKTATCSPSAVVAGSVTSSVVSVFCRTWPRPGKCLRVAVTRARARPSTIVPAAVITLSAVLPYWRSYAPMGSLSASVAGRDDVDDRRQIEVDPGIPQRLAHGLGECGQLGGGQGALHEAGRQGVEPGTAKSLDVAALLIRGHPEARAGGERLPARGSCGQLAGR